MRIQLEKIIEMIIFSSCIHISMIFSSLETHHTKTSDHIPHTPIQMLSCRAGPSGSFAPKRYLRMGLHHWPQPRCAQRCQGCGQSSRMKPTLSYWEGSGPCHSIWQQWSPLLPPSLHGSHSSRHGAIISHKHMLMATQLQKPFFCPLEPNAEDNDGFVTDCNSQIASRWHTSLRAAWGPLAPGQLGF